MPSHLFQALLEAARAQAEPQHLLFVFAGSELPAGASAEQRARYEAGEGGALTPLMCVDKPAEGLHSFAALVEESRQAGPPWQVVFVAALAGRGGQPPGDEEVERALRRMVEAVNTGAVDGLLAYNPQGEVLSFQ